MYMSHDNGVLSSQVAGKALKQLAGKKIKRMRQEDVPEETSCRGILQATHSVPEGKVILS